MRKIFFAESEIIKYPYNIAIITKIIEIHQIQIKLFSSIFKKVLYWSFFKAFSNIWEKNLTENTFYLPMYSKYYDKYLELLLKF